MIPYGKKSLFCVCLAEWCLRNFSVPFAFLFFASFLLQSDFFSLLFFFLFHLFSSFVVLFRSAVIQIEWLVECFFHRRYGNVLRRKEKKILLFVYFSLFFAITLLNNFVCCFLTSFYFLFTKFWRFSTTPWD